MAGEITVRQFLDAYRPAYDAVKATGRQRGIKAYEDLFAVADRTDDMQEAQLIIEREGMTLRLTTEDAIEINEETLAKLDPLDEVTTVSTLLNLDIYRNAKSVEDITYRASLLDIQVQRLTAKGKLKIFLAASLADKLIAYDKAKRLLREWPDEVKAKAALSAMAGQRAAVRELVSIIEEEVDLKADEIFDDQFFMVNMLAPQNIDAYGRTKKTMHPDAVKAYREMTEEILSDMTLTEILMREQQNAMVYAI